MKYLGDGFVTCPQCEGYGREYHTSDDCRRCDGVGAIPIDDYPGPPMPRRSHYKSTIWSPLLCDPETIERMEEIERAAS